MYTERNVSCYPHAHDRSRLAGIYGRLYVIEAELTRQ